MAEPPSEQTLTPSQEAAVARRSGPLLLSASAGSGKTSVLVERFVRAVLSDGLAPSRILVVTFTERAAAELRERVCARLLAAGDPAAAAEAEVAPISTFHSFCALLLRTNPLAAGLEHDFTVLDGPGADRLSLLAFRSAFAELLSGGRRAEAIDLAAAFSFDRFRRIILGTFAAQRSLGIVRPSLPLSAAPLEEAGSDPGSDAEALAACSLIDLALGLFADRYGALKRSRSALDFDDLELRAIELLQAHPDLRSTLSSHFELLMVDEFQDTNRRQLALLRLLERDNLFTVGDEFQSIYGFRFADPGLFRARRLSLSASGAALTLADNFRSLPPLISLVNSLFSPRFGEAFTPLVASRPAPDDEGAGEAKEALAGPLADPPVELLLTDTRGWADSPHAPAIAGTLPPAPLWRQAEARLLADRLADLIASGSAGPGDVAVLLRAASDLPVYEQALVERGVAVLASSGGFWGDRWVGDLLVWLRCLANPLDSVALFSVLSSPLVGLSSDGLALVSLSARASRTSAWEAVGGDGGDLPADLSRGLSPADRGSLSRFTRFVAEERRLLPTLSLPELLSRAVSFFAYDGYLLSLPFGEQRLADASKLIDLARRFEEASGRDLRGFLDDAAYRAAFAAGAEPHAPTDASPDAVRIMTIHASKGLEFPVVCLADLGRAPVASAPDLLVDSDSGRLGLRLAGLDGSPPVDCLRFGELLAERRALEAAEEERIIYVALTRARDRLILSGAFDFSKGPGSGGAPINWLVPALSPELPALAAALQEPVVDLALAGVPFRCGLNGPYTYGEALHNSICR